MVGSPCPGDSLETKVCKNSEFETEGAGIHNVLREYEAHSPDLWNSKMLAKGIKHYRMQCSTGRLCQQMIFQ